MDKKNVGKKTLNARKAKGLTQAELSEVSSISIRTIQRLESGDVIPRVYTLKTLSKHLGVDLLIESEDSDGIDNKNFIHDLLIKWINEIKNLFNLKTYTMKKIIILSSVLCLLSIGLFALTTNSKSENHNSISNGQEQFGDFTKKSKYLPCGFYAQIIDGDTTYCGLITDNSADGVLDVIQPKLCCVTDFGYKLDILSVGVQPKQFRGQSPEEWRQNHKYSKTDTLMFTELGFAFSVPSYDYYDTCNVKFNPNGRDLIGFYFNKKFSSPIGIGGLDEKYFRDYYDLKEVLNKFKGAPNLKVTLNNNLVNKSDYDKLENYEIISFEDITSVIVYKENNDCEIIIKTK